MQANDFMNAEDVARYLHLGKNAVYQLAKEGTIASYRMGRKLRFTREDVDAYLASMHQGNCTHATGAPSPSDAFPALEPSRSFHPAIGSDSSEISSAASFGILPGDPFIIAGNDTAADIIAHALLQTGVPAARRACGSYTALVNLYAGQASAAVIHLYDQSSNSCNIPYVKRLAPGVSVIVAHLHQRKQGLIVRAGNPKRLTSWGALLHEGVRLSNRPKGSGARILLDEKLRAMEARSENMIGYDAPASASANAIRHVAGGLADVTIGTEHEARCAAGVDFIPLQDEWVDIVIRKTPKTLSVVRTLEALMESDLLHAEIASLDAGDASKLGCIVFEN